LHTDATSKDLFFVTAFNRFGRLGICVLLLHLRVFVVRLLPGRPKERPLLVLRVYLLQLFLSLDSPVQLSFHLFISALHDSTACTHCLGRVGLQDSQSLRLLLLVVQYQFFVLVEADKVEMQVFDSVLLQQVVLLQQTAQVDGLREGGRVLFSERRVTSDRGVVASVV